MKHFVRGIWIVIFGLLSFETYAQAEVIETDSLTIEQPDSINRHFPNKATMFSAVLPGLGQIYNRQVWKIPFIYGGFIGLGITIERYQRLYNNYRRAYFELNDKNPNTTYYYEVLPEGSEVSESNPKQYNDLLIKGIEDRSRSRDLYIIGTVGFYLFNILDANVNAHFIDFDISEDLSFNLEPVGFDPFTNNPVYGICMRYQF